MLGGMSLDRDALRAEQARQQACERQGRHFIVLRLLKQGINRISGVYVLLASPYIDPTTNQTKYQFTEAGGHVVFTYDDFRGDNYAKILDCEYNRRFLASHLSSRYWEIEDKEVLSGVERIAAEMAASAVRKRADDVQVPVETTLSDTDLETEMARLQAEAARRKIKLADDKRTPVRAQVPAEDNAENVPTTNAGMAELADLAIEYHAKGDDDLAGEEVVDEQGSAGSDLGAVETKRTYKSKGKRKARNTPVRKEPELVTE